MMHVFLDAEIRHRNVEVQGSTEADRRKVGRAVAAGADLVELGERRDFSELRNPAGMHDRHADIVAELVLQNFAAVVDGVEHLADSDRRHRVLADEF